MPSNKQAGSRHARSQQQLVCSGGGGLGDCLKVGQVVQKHLHSTPGTAGRQYGGRSRRQQWQGACLLACLTGWLSQPQLQAGTQPAAAAGSAGHLERASLPHQASPQECTRKLGGRQRQEMSEGDLQAAQAQA